MCVIVHKKADVPLRRSILQECWNKNSHGAGLMWAENGELHVNKGFMTFDDLWSFISSEDFDAENKEIVLHFRLATSGHKNAEMCHPFIVHNKLAFAHNGIFSEDETIDETDRHSDTLLFCNRILKQLPHNFLNNQGIKCLIEKYADDSTLVFMDNRGVITKMGCLFDAMETKGYWFSNSSWSTKLLEEAINRLQNRKGFYGYERYKYSEENWENDYLRSTGKAKIAPVKIKREIPLLADDGV